MILVDSASWQPFLGFLYPLDSAAVVRMILILDLAIILADVFQMCRAWLLVIQFVAMVSEKEMKFVTVGVKQNVLIPVVMLPPVS